MTRASRRNFSKPVQREMIARSKNADGEICCEGCGLVLMGKPYDFDHTIPEALLAEWQKAGKKLTAEDGKLLGRYCCHRGPNSKTSKDVAQIAKAKNQEDKNNGLRKEGRKIENRNNLKSDPKPRAIDKAAVDEAAKLPRRRLFG